MSAMWIVEQEDGSVSQHHERPGTAGVARGRRQAMAPREVDFAVERWDWDAGRIVPLADGAATRIDAAHVARHGDHAIAIARAAKAMEARLILAGVALDGLLAAEARATGKDLAELARVVAAKAAEADQHEIDRIAAKRQARSM